MIVHCYIINNFVALYNWVPLCHKIKSYDIKYSRIIIIICGQFLTSNFLMIMRSRVVASINLESVTVFIMTSYSIVHHS